LLLSACSPAYVLRAGYEEARILWRRQPIVELLRHPDLEAATREKLSLVLEARVFAEDQLALRVRGSYTSFSRVDSSQVVHIVAAAQRLRLEPYTWWFPIVGRMPYKGFFDEADARALAASLDRRGYDTIVRPSVAFSTLGWFDDPLLSTLLRREPVELVDTVLHELLHNTFFAPGQATFNESFASFVGGRGAAAFFGSRDGPESPTAVRARALWSDAVTFSTFLSHLADDLRRAYDRGLTLEERAARFDAAQAEFAAIEFHTDAYAYFPRVRLNNAVILHLLAYHRDLAVFERVYEGTGRDLGAAIRRVIAAARDADDPFAAVAAIPPLARGLADRDAWR
jgi:predicted aminopeptidase